MFSGAAVLVYDPKAHLQPTIPQLERWSKEQKDSIQSHLAYTESKTAKESANASRAMSEEAQRKRKERELRKQAEAARKAAAGEDVDNSAAFLVSPSTESQKDSTTLPEGLNTSSISYTIVIPSSSSSLEWYDSSVRSYSTIEAAREAGVWDYPSDLSERARCGVFKDLWKQGYFMGGGIKFGGEYLVYPGIVLYYHFVLVCFTVLFFITSGDPLRYHSHFTATVIESPVASLRPMEIVAHGRLGTATKKAHLLCGWDDEKKEVSYLSLEWSGFG